MSLDMRLPWRGGFDEAKPREVMSAHRSDGDPVNPEQNDGIHVVTWRRSTPRSPRGGTANTN